MNPVILTLFFEGTNTFSFDKVIKDNDKRGQKKRIREQMKIEKGDFSGVYILTYKTEKPFPRLFEKNKRGIIYIGKSKNLVDRINKLINDMTSEGKSNRYHSGGLTYRMFYKDKGPIKNVKEDKEKFIIYYKKHQSPGKEEAKLLSTYIKHYYNTPILNISLSRNEILKMK